MGLRCPFDPSKDPLVRRSVAARSTRRRHGKLLQFWGFQQQNNGAVKHDENQPFIKTETNDIYNELK
jgi:hypothetical protein